MCCVFVIYGQKYWVAETLVNPKIQTTLKKLTLIEYLRTFTQVLFV